MQLYIIFLAKIVPLASVFCPQEFLICNLPVVTWYASLDAPVTTTSVLLRMLAPQRGTHCLRISVPYLIPQF